MPVKLVELPMDIIVEIVFMAIISELNSKNCKEEPSILSSHPIFLSSLEYFTDDKWQVICNIITITNSPENFGECSWRKTFFKLQNTDLELLNFTLNGNFGKVRRIVDWFDEPMDAEEQNKLRRNFFNMFKAHDKRRGTDFKETFPELAEFYDECGKL